jgi:hypothetical protein
VPHEAIANDRRRDRPLSAHPPLATRVAGVLALLLGLGFGLPGIYGTWYFAEHGQVWTFLDLPTYGDGPFEEIGIDTSVLLLLAFLLVCVAEIVLGWWLWSGHSGNRAFAALLLPVELVFWIGFALPFGPVVGVVRTALVLVGGRASES